MGIARGAKGNGHPDWGLNWSYLFHLYSTTLFTKCNPPNQVFCFAEFGRLFLFNVLFLQKDWGDIWTFPPERRILKATKPPPSNLCFPCPGGGGHPPERAQPRDLTHNEMVEPIRPPVFRRPFCKKESGTHVVVRHRPGPHHLAHHRPGRPEAAGAHRLLQRPDPGCGAGPGAVAHAGAGLPHLRAGGVRRRPVAHHPGDHRGHLHL